MAIQVVDETKLWAKVPRQDCDAFMAARRLAGVQRSGGGTGGTSGGAAADGKPATDAGSGGADDESYAAGVSREGMAGWHKLFGPGLSPSGTLPEDEAPDPDDGDDYRR